MGILAAVLLLVGITVRPDTETPTAQDALWSVGANDRAGAEARGWPGELVPDELMLARWSASAGLAQSRGADGRASDDATAGRSPTPRRDGLESLERIAAADTIEPR